MNQTDFLKRLLPAAIVVVVACGYHLIQVGEGLPPGVDSIFAPVVINKSSEPAFETIVTEALRTKLIRQGVNAGPDCPVRWQGELLSVGTGPSIVKPPDAGVIASTSNIPAYAGYRVSAFLRLTLSRNGQVLSKVEVTGQEDFLPDAYNDVLNLEAQRKLALDRLADHLVEDAYAKLTMR